MSAKNTPVRWGDIMDDDTDDDNNDNSIEPKPKRKIKRSVMERRKRLKPFGDVLTCSIDENAKKTMISPDEIFIIRAFDKKEEKQVELDKPIISNIKCRNCGEPHWTSKCHNPQQHQPEGYQPEEVYQPEEYQPSTTSTNVYVPPSLRNRTNQGNSSSDNRNSYDEDDCKVRINNLSDYTTQDDVHELVEKIARPRRVYLAKDKHTGKSRGFAYVAFYHPDEVDKVIDVLNGHHYDHMVLEVERAWRR